MTRKPPLRRSLPPEFNKLGGHFHQDIDLDAKKLPELAAHLAGCFSDGDRSPLRTYLAGLVDSAPAEEVQRQWNVVCTDWYFEDGEEVRRLLAAIRDALGQARTRPGWVAASMGRTHGRRASAPKQR